MCVCVFMHAVIPDNGWMGQQWRVRKQCNRRILFFGM